MTHKEEAAILAVTVLAFGWALLCAFTGDIVLAVMFGMAAGYLAVTYFLLLTGR